MTNKIEAVTEFLSACPYMGKDTFINFVTDENNDDSTSLLSTQYGKVIRRYTDGECLINLPLEIRQTKPYSKESNSTANAEYMQEVQFFLDWINKQGRENNFPDFGDRCSVQKMSTPDSAATPVLLGTNEAETTGIYAFQIEILYLERK